MSEGGSTRLDSGNTGIQVITLISNEDLINSSRSKMIERNSFECLNKIETNNRPNRSSSDEVNG